ncbi:hypothetical protein PRV_00875 [Mycoplasma parvum str. Indiana]|uniref:Uncharacterized protein n=1 Tax=Mycoplasma parvum str. Indiana TaxID=1403316 RepID=U5NCA7_9MOLU|nr:hypothetical protein PRV_00875 [Mycoplasma parvum str. Indiana]
MERISPIFCWTSKGGLGKLTRKSFWKDNTGWAVANFERENIPFLFLENQKNI